MSEEFSLKQLKDLLKIQDGVPCCGIDEVILLLAEYINDEELTVTLNKYAEMYSNSFEEAYAKLIKMDKRLNTALVLAEQIEEVLKKE